MTTNLEVSRTGIDSTAQRLTDVLLHARAALPPAANGKPPKAMTPRVAYLRNEIGAGKMKPLQNVLAIVADDLASGVPASEHLAWIDRLRAEVEAMAVVAWMQRRREDAPLPIQLVRESLKETTLECKANPAQERMVVDPTNPVTLDAFITTAERHHEQLGKTIRLAHSLRVQQGATPRRVYGAGRGA